MRKRWVAGFTLVELIIVILVIAILVTVTVVGYNGIKKTATVRAAQNDLSIVAVEMQRVFLKTGAYPTTLPPDVEVSDGVTLTLVKAGSSPYYSSLNTVQNGVLLSQICSDLITEGVGKGTDQGGAVQDYITGCGNWNHDSMQITGWSTKKWDTPVVESSLTSYANTFTTSDTWNKAHETVVKNFYNQLVTRLKQQGGSFPVYSFWDFWATPSNGGVMLQPLESTPKMFPYYCTQASSTKYKDILWHVSEDTKLTTGAC